MRSGTRRKYKFSPKVDFRQADWQKGDDCIWFHIAYQILMGKSLHFLTQNHRMEQCRFTGVIV